MKIHELKILPEYLRKKLYGDKLFEIRINDRDYQVGDLVIYTDRIGCKYVYRITYITDYEQEEGYIVFGERPLVESEAQSLIKR